MVEIVLKVCYRLECSALINILVYFSVLNFRVRINHLPSNIPWKV